MTASAELPKPSGLARLPVRSMAITAGGYAWQVDAVVDQAALLTAAEDFEVFPFGLMLWEAAIGLSDHLAERCARLLAQRSVLEIGAGVGLAGLVAARLGARVVQTDHSAEALALCRRNAARNAIVGVTQRRADWLAWPDDLVGFDVLLGSDVLYDPPQHAAVLAIAVVSLAPGGTLILSDPSRAGTDAFVARLADTGFRVTETVRPIPALHPTQAGQVVGVRVIEAQAPAIPHGGG
ncbi:MAG: methyltransferase domain-containing protein [Hyphomicrobiaceae bacterium]|nr:methyltransferase domain-containing protein [Hyphomicrobiaceae bacterium]